MKKFTFILISVCLFGQTELFSQTVNDVLIKDIDVEYIQIVGTSQWLGNKVTIEIDFGQLDQLFNSNDTQVKDENGVLMQFNSMIDALNFFSKNGYDYVNSYAFTVSSEKVYHYLLKKKTL